MRTTHEHAVRNNTSHTARLSSAFRIVSRLRRCSQLIVQGSRVPTNLFIHDANVFINVEGCLKLSRLITPIFPSRRHILAQTTRKSISYLINSSYSTASHGVRFSPYELTAISVISCKCLMHCAGVNWSVAMAVIMYLKNETCNASHTQGALLAMVHVDTGNLPPSEVKSFRIFFAIAGSIRFSALFTSLHCIRA